MTDAKYLPIAFAVISGNVKTAELILKNMSEELFHSKESLLMSYAAFHGRVEMIEFLIGWGVGINLKNNAEYFKTPLQIACSRDHVEVVKTLLSHNAEWKDRSEDNAAIVLASLKGNVEIVKMLEAKGAILPQHWATYYKHFPQFPLEIVKIFVKKISPSKTQLNQAFSHALAKNNVPLVEYLIDCGADINCGEGFTPLCITASTNQVDMMVSLIDKGASVDSRSDFESTPLHCAVQYKQKQAAELLVNRGCHLNAQDHRGYTPLHVAVISNASDIARMLIEHGADVEVKCKSGNTPLEITGIRSEDTAVELVNGGAKINKKLFAAKELFLGDVDNLPVLIDKEWYVAWMITVLRGDEKMAQELVNRKYSLTSQHAVTAIKKRQTRILQMILPFIYKGVTTMVCNTHSSLHCYTYCIY